MNSEHPQHEEVPSKIHRLAANERAKLLGNERSEGLERLTQRARVNLESYGRALLQTNTNVPDAVDSLIRASALRKPDVQAGISAQFDRLERSTNEEDQMALLALSKRLATADTEAAG
jgi:hypothetical protein